MLGSWAIEPLTGTILAFNFAVLLIAALFIGLESQGLATLRVKATGQLPSLTLGAQKRWHLFLSHSWDNQDAVATIKRQLQLLLPGIKVFLEYAPRARPRRPPLRTCTRPGSLSSEALESRSAASMT